MGKKLILIVLGLISLTAFSVACGSATAAGSIRLDMVSPQVSPAPFDERNSTVLRCASVLEDSGGISITASKSKDMVTSQLLFLQPDSSQGVFLVAVVPVTGKEYEYDMTQAKYYRVTADSASSALDRFGMAYTDWQTGAMNGSEQFPCCE